MHNEEEQREAIVPATDHDLVLGPPHKPTLRSPGARWPRPKPWRRPGWPCAPPRPCPPGDLCPATTDPADSGRHTIDSRHGVPHRCVSKRRPASSWGRAIHDRIVWTRKELAVATEDKAGPVRVQGTGIRGIEVRSIDWIPDSERHGKVWHQAPRWFLGNFQYFPIPIRLIGPAPGPSPAVDIRRGPGGILGGPRLQGLAPTPGPHVGPPPNNQAAPPFGFRGGIIALFAMVFTYMAFNVA